MPTGVEPPERSIRVAWRRVFAGVCLLVLVLGAASFGLAVVQRSMFGRVTSHFGAEVGTSVETSREMRSTESALGTILYEFGTEADRRDALREFEERAQRVEAGLDTAAALVTSDVERHHVTQARDAWRSMVADVEAAPARWGTGEVQAALAAGDDPYRATWEALGDAQGHLDEHVATSVEHLAEETERVEDQLGVLLPSLLGAIVVVLGAVLWAGGRLTQRIIHPIAALTGAARRMQEGDLATRVDLDRSVGELGELADAMNVLASSLEVSHAELQTQATTDPLTGLPNRRALQEHLDRRLVAGRDDHLALLFIDLDDFKIVNDTLGHAAGDALLRVVSDRLRAACREGDFVARIGGDEFAVVVDPAGGPAMPPATSVAERILAALAYPIALDDGSVTTGCSIGIAEVVAGTDAVEEALRNADVAMYLAKSRGKNCFERFAPATHAAIVARLELKRDLRRAAELDQLRLHYQPVIDVDSGDLLGLEALVRWAHPDLGLLPPGEFIPLAEDTGDIVAIGEWVLARACGDLHQLARDGRVAPRTWVSVNVSPRQLLAGFSDTVRAALGDTDVPADNLVLELTESVLITDRAEAVAALLPLQRDGVRIALDDFGTGFSSLRYLQDLPVDIIKLDRSFTAGERTEDRPAVLEAIVHLGRTLGVEVIAEGIEHPEQLRRLHQLGHLGGQGFLLGRPAALESVDVAARSVVGASAPPVGPR